MYFCLKPNYYLLLVHFKRGKEKETRVSGIGNFDLSFHEQIPLCLKGINQLENFFLNY